MAEITYEVVQAVAVDAVVDLYKAGGWWREEPGAREVIPRMVTGSFCFMVAREAEGGRIVGMGRAISDGCSDAYIQDVVVLHPWRRHGIGRELVSRLARYCADRQLAWIGLVAEPGTQAFYASLGFGALEGYQPMLFGKKPA
jgi:GNAT superfamily N-acetyltransferase